MKTYKCPLCASNLSEDRYLKVVGAWEEKEKVQKEIKDKLREAEEQKKLLLQQAKKNKLELERERRRLVEERKGLRREFEREFKKQSRQLEKQGVEKGKMSEKRRADKLAYQLEQKMGAIDDMNNKIKQLKEQLKKGTTSQVEGLDFEKLVVKELESKFSEDKVEPYGKKGDILQRVYYKKKEFGSILYECKKTDKYSKGFVKQTKTAVGQRKATFGVLVTAAFKKDTEGFYVEDGIIVVHPFGVPYIAQILRNNIIELTLASQTKKEIDIKAKELINYIAGDEFKSMANDTIYRAKLLGEILAKEMKSHMSLWHDRFEHYKNIHSNVNILEGNTKAILKGEKPQKIQKDELLRLPFSVEVVKKQ